MEAFEEKFENATNALELPGGVVCASDSQGKSYYAKAFGINSLKDDKKPMAEDSVFMLASCTKLLTSIAALQCVEKGQLRLDEDVTRLLPELKGIEILKGFEEDSGKPILLKAKNIITLRHLLTHTSGLAYDAFTPELTRWRATRGEQPGLSAGTVLWRCLTPLVHEPGESYAYSTGLDWAGIMVARVTKMTLETYMQKNIWEPLGIKDMYFHLENRPDMLSRLPEMSERQGGITMFGTPADGDEELQWTANKVWRETGLVDDSGGAGCYGTAIDYQKVLQSLATNDEKLLSSSMLDQMCTPQLGPESQATADVLFGFPEYHSIGAPGIPMGTKYGIGLAGMVILEDLPDRRRKGSLHWSGFPNNFWWVDRTSGVSGFYGSQVIPPADPKSISMFTEFEKAFYAKVNKGKQL